MMLPCSYFHSPGGFGFDGFSIIGLLTLDDGLGVFSGFKLVGSLILGEVKLILNFRLASGQVVIAFLLLEGCADLGFQFNRALLRILDVGFQPRGAFLETLHRGFKRANCAQRRVGGLAMLKRADSAGVRYFFKWASARLKSSIVIPNSFSNSNRDIFLAS